jgi:hypothetical protein
MAVPDDLNVDVMSEQLLAVVGALDHIASRLSPEEAADLLDSAALQTFWRDWPAASTWAGMLCRRLSLDLAAPAAAVDDFDDEIGGSG